MNTVFKRKASKILLLGVLVLGILITACDQYAIVQTPKDNPSENKVILEPIGESQIELEFAPRVEIQSQQEQNTDLQDPKQADAFSALPVSRAMVAKMIALTFYDKIELETMDREIEYTDTKPEDWYDLYINNVAVQGYMTGYKDTFEPLQPLTLQHAQWLIDRIDPKNKLKVNMTEETKNMPISYRSWVELYTRVLEKMAGESSVQEIFGIRQQSHILVATPGNNAQLSSWNMATDKGIFGFAGLPIDAYMDQKIKLLMKDGEVFAFLEAEEKMPLLTHGYIAKVEEDSITIFVGGVHRKYTYKGTSDVKVGQIADIRIEQGNAKEIQIYEKGMQGKIMRVDSDFVELQQEGIIPVWEDIKIYSVTGDTVGWRQLRNLLVGSDLAEFILKDEKICAALIKKTVKTDTIRVALHTSGFKGLVHEAVELTSNTDYIVEYDQQQKVYPKGEVVSFSSETNKTLFGASRVYIRPKDAGGKIQILSIERGWGDGQKPLYRGTIEVAVQGKGYSIINEIPMEAYLYAVVPSEMPTSHGDEAAKVQAVTARSYAYTQLHANRYHMYGGNVDDSIQCQVYNNSPENQTSIKAVNDTKGLGLTYKGNVVSANFFSTSAGYTANAGEVWANSRTKEFPTATPSYLSAVKQYNDKEYGELSKEENADLFFRDTNLGGFDKKFAWFRWNVTMNTQELSAAINENLKERYEASPKLIRTLSDTNVFRSRPVDTIGELKDLKVVKRGQGGNIMELVLVGTKATVKIITEYNIRTILRPKQYLPNGENVVLHRIDGSRLANYSMLPSTFCTIEKKKDTKGVLQAVTFYGGGNGHGVGMSQNGVKGMVDQGYTYEQIIQHYYKGTEIKPIY